MKKAAFLLLTISLLVVGFSSVSAQIIDQPLVSIRLTRPELITQNLFGIKRAILENRTGQKITASLEDQLLESLISERLILQASESINIFATDTEVDNRINQMRYASGPEVTEKLYQQLIETRLGIAYYQFREEIRSELVVQKYLLSEKRVLFESIRLPDAVEIEEFYGQNIQRFIQPEAVRLSQIFFSTAKLQPDGKLEKEKIAFQVERDIRNGVGVFENLVTLYSDDPASRMKNGDIGYLFRNDLAAKAQLGDDFFSAAFDLHESEISPIVESLYGYHLLKATEKLPKKILSLSDQVHPLANTTVQETISSALLNQKQAVAFETALREVDTELRERAEIQYF
ncbi:MAG: hypothetical protein HN368_24480 [Spirochaetales bacterium]|nr:hypothetical protein [Spirochaetales bacterium]